LRLKEINAQEFSGWAVSGTPADCIKLGLGQLLKEKPDLVLSGMNAGANVGPDILYSGTVAAATEAAASGFRALAVSHCSAKHMDVDAYAAFTVKIMTQIPWHSLPGRRVINLNLPSCPYTEFKGLALCPQTDALWKDWYHEHADPRGHKYWWLDGEIPMAQVRPGTDKYQLEAGWATLTPLKFDFTDRETLAQLRTCLSIATYFEEE